MISVLNQINTIYLYTLFGLSTGFRLHNTWLQSNCKSPGERTFSGRWLFKAFFGCTVLAEGTCCQPCLSPASSPLIPTFPPVFCLARGAGGLEGKGIPAISRILCAPGFQHPTTWWWENFWCVIWDLWCCNGVAGESPKCGGLICQKCHAAVLMVAVGCSKQTFLRATHC